MSNQENQNENEPTTTATSVVACVTGNNLHAVIGTVRTEDTTGQFCMSSAVIALRFMGAN